MGDSRDTRIAAIRVADGHVSPRTEIGRESRQRLLNASK